METYIEQVNRARLTKNKATEAQSKVAEKYRSSRKLFVYGSLGPGQPNAHLLTRMGGSWKEAIVTGYLQTTDRARGIYFPLLRPHPDGPEVSGHVFTSEALPKIWPQLDRFEGPAYVRLLTLFNYRTGQTGVANVYADASQEYI